MECKKIHFSGHATVQMFKRNIPVEIVENVLKSGEIIKEYPEDNPYPSFLMLGFANTRPIHVLVATDLRGNCFIITTYEPDIKLWSENYKTKK